METKSENDARRGRRRALGSLSLVLFLLIVLALVFFLFHKTQVAAVEGDRLIVYKDYYVFSITTELEDPDHDGTWEVRRRSLSWF